MASHILIPLSSIQKKLFGTLKLYGCFLTMNFYPYFGLKNRKPLAYYLQSSTKVLPIAFD